MKTKQLSVLSLILFTSVQNYCSAASKPAEKKAAPVEVSAVVLDESDDIYGKARTTISGTGLKIEIINTNVVVVANAPTWQVMFYNKLSKKCLSMSMDEWLKHNQVTTYQGRDWNRTTLAVNHPTDTTRLGRKMRIWHVPGSKAPSGIVPHKKLPNADYVDLEHLPVAPEAVAIMQTCLSTPHSSGIPIEMINHMPTLKTEAFRTNTTGDQTFLKTLKIDEKRVPESFFDYPKTFIAERSEVKVINDSQRQSQVKAAFDTFMP